jgi:hypothetical protein
MRSDATVSKTLGVSSNEFSRVVAAFLIAPFAHHFFEYPATGNVIRGLALDFLVSGIGFMSLVTLTREQNFRLVYDCRARRLSFVGPR